MAYLKNAYQKISAISKKNGTPSDLFYGKWEKLGDILRKLTVVYQKIEFVKKF